MATQTDNFHHAITKALKDKRVTISVGDAGEIGQDLEHSRKRGEIIEACEATDSPVMTFYIDKKYQGWIMVLVGYGDESICDHVSNDYLNELTEDLY